MTTEPRVETVATRSRESGELTAYGLRFVAGTADPVFLWRVGDDAGNVWYDSTAQATEACESRNEDLGSRERAEMPAEIFWILGVIESERPQALTAATPVEEISTINAPVDSAAVAELPPPFLQIDDPSGLKAALGGILEKIRRR